MNRKEHLLDIAQEECAEVAQRISKALRFSLEEIQPGQSLNNADRIMKEYYDLKAMIKILQKEGHLPEWSEERSSFQMNAKIIQIEKYILHSKSVGTLTEDICKIEVPTEPVALERHVCISQDHDHYEYDSYTTGRKQDYGHHTLNTENGWDCYSWDRDEYTETMYMKRPKEGKGWKSFRVITYTSTFEDFLSEVMARAYYESVPNFGYKSIVEVDTVSGQQVKILEQSMPGE